MLILPDIIITFLLSLSFHLYGISFSVPSLPVCKSHRPRGRIELDLFPFRYSTQTWSSWSKIIGNGKNLLLHHVNYFLPLLCALGPFFSSLQFHMDQFHPLYIFCIYYRSVHCGHHVACRKELGITTLINLISTVYKISIFYFFPSTYFCATDIILYIFFYCVSINQLLKL